jgi:hypothetical protein
MIIEENSSDGVSVNSSIPISGSEILSARIKKTDVGWDDKD